MHFATIIIYLFIFLQLFLKKKLILINILLYKAMHGRPQFYWIFGKLLPPGVTEMASYTIK